MMAWTTTSAALKVLLETVTTSGAVYVGDRHIRDKERLMSLFQLAGAGRDFLQGWRILRSQVTERNWTTTRNKAIEKYALRVIMSDTKTTGSEASFNALLDRAWAVIRAVKTIGSAHFIDAQRTPAIDWIQYGDMLCHYAEIIVTVEELYTISATQPAHVNSTAATREDYADVADQIAAYVDAVADSGVIHEERPFVTTGDERRAAMLVDGAAPSDPKNVRTWKVYRESDSEARGLGNRVASTGTWKVVGHWGWKDTASSYDAFQTHIDAVRAVYRGVGCLGNVANPTMAISTPLQVSNVDGVMYSDLLCHMAECEIGVEEVVHV